HLIVPVPCRVILIPICSGVAERHESADGNVWDTGVVEGCVAREVGDAELSAGVQQAIHGPIVQVVGHQMISAKSKIIDQARCENVRTSNGHLPVIGRTIASSGGCDAAAEDGGVLPVVTDKQANLVAEVLVNAFQGLIRRDVGHYWAGEGV